MVPTIIRYPNLTFSMTPPQIVSPADTFIYPGAPPAIFYSGATLARLEGKARLLGDGFGPDLQV